MGKITGDIVLSILVISHNQRNLLKRCMESILLQELPFSHEIILSDDRSSDGTWDLIEEYQRLYPDIVRGVKCNSDECNPFSNSERCGWNKLTAYKAAKGKYFVNLDADDYLVGTELYKRQVERLDEHPECSMCMSRVWQLDEGSDWDTGFTWPDKPIMADNAIFDMKTFILEGLIGQNQIYMFRRNQQWSGDDFGVFFDDKFITFHYLNYGSCIFLDMYGYVWIQYKESITHRDSLGNDIIYSLIPLYHAEKEPIQAPLYLKYGIPMLVHLMKSWNMYFDTSDCNVDITKFEGFLFEYFHREKRSLIQKARAILIRLLLLVDNIFKLQSVKYKMLLYYLMTNKRIFSQVPDESWKI